MNIFVHISILFWSTWIWSVAGQTTETCECQLRRPVNLFLQQLEGTWYIVAGVNVTDPSQQSRCVTLNYRYNYGQGTVTEFRAYIPYNETNVASDTAIYGMVTPGIVDATYLIDNDTVEWNFHNYYIQYTPDVSFIFSICERFNQQIFADTVALVTRNRQVDIATIESIYNSVGITFGNNSNNELFIVNQTNCSN